MKAAAPTCRQVPKKNRIRPPFLIPKKKTFKYIYFIQIDKLQQLVEENKINIRSLKTELESERSEKVYYLTEVEALKKER